MQVGKAAAKSTLALPAAALALALTNFNIEALDPPWATYMAIGNFQILSGQKLTGIKYW
jgi:hypothetical protein